jgi:GNAT superfamily N-acetyltransferase
MRRRLRSALGSKTVRDRIPAKDAAASYFLRRTYLGPFTASPWSARHGPLGPRCGGKVVRCLICPVEGSVVSSDTEARVMEVTVIQYSTDVSNLRVRQLAGGFFEGWTNPVDTNRHLEVLRGSDVVVLALDDDRVVGFVTAITDGALAAFIPLLEVLPKYRGRGISSELMRRMLDALAGYSNIDLSCDPELQPFYARFGMQPGGSMYIRRPKPHGAQ